MRVLPVDQMPPSVELTGHGDQLSYEGVCGGIVGVDGGRGLGVMVVRRSQIQEDFRFLIFERLSIKAARLTSLPN